MCSLDVSMLRSSRCCCDLKLLDGRIYSHIFNVDGVLHQQTWVLRGRHSDAAHHLRINSVAIDTLVGQILIGVASRKRETFQVGYLEADWMDVL